MTDYLDALAAAEEEWQRGLARCTLLTEQVARLTKERDEALATAAEWRRGTHILKKQTEDAEAARAESLSRISQTLNHLQMNEHHPMGSDWRKGKMDGLSYALAEMAEHKEAT